MEKRTQILKATVAVLLAVLLLYSCDEKKQNNQDSSTSGTVTDHEGNVYKTIKIGNQTWMAENMRCTTSPTGKQWQEQPATETYTPFIAHKTGAVNGWEYDEYYYNWAAAVDYEPDSNAAFNYQLELPCRGICPKGWHIPSDAEWDALVAYVGVHFSDGSSVAKAFASQYGWLQSDTERAVGNEPSLNNASGFGAVPAS